MRKVVVAVAAVAVLAIVAYIALGHHRNPDAGAGSAAVAKHRDPKAPALPEQTAFSADPKDPEVQKVFDERKARALNQLQATLLQKVQACTPAASGSAPPSKPHALNLSLIWDPQLSTPEMQRFVVDKTTVLDPGDSISPTAARCLDSFQGATLDLLLHADRIPKDIRQLQLPVTLPLP